MLIETTVGVALAGLLFSIRQAGIRRKFIKQHGLQIRTENEAIAETWRSSHPKTERLLVKRKFKTNGFLAPTITTKQRFRRSR